MIPIPCRRCKVVQHKKVLFLTKIPAELKQMATRAEFSYSIYLMAHVWAAANFPRAAIVLVHVHWPSKWMPFSKFFM